MKLVKKEMNWDAVGITASVACAVHCAILPLLLTSLPLFGINIIDNPAFETGMILLAFAIGSYSLWHGYRKHHHKMSPLWLFGAGMLFLFAKQAWHDYQYWLLPFAVILIVSAHVLNYRSCRIHNHAHEDDCNH